MRHNDEGKRRCCARGVHCGVALAKFEVDDIHAHVGVSYGTVSVGLLGGYGGKHTYLMNGNCVDRLGECLSLAGRGELVVTAEVHAAMSASEAQNQQFTYLPVTLEGCPYHDETDDVYFKVTNRKSNQWGQVRLLLTEDSSLRTVSVSESSQVKGAVSSDTQVSMRRRVLTSFLDNTHSRHIDTKGLERCTYADIVSCVPQPVREALTAGTFRGLSELRTVTTLFLKLETYSTDKYCNLSDLQPFVLAMQECLEECGGMLRQFIIDDKGCVLIGLWGVPGASYPVNCSLAVRCAWMMQSEASKSHHSVSIGITTGRVYCGVIGTEYRRDYVAIGKSVNLSARLMSQAKGRILLDESTLEKLPMETSCHTKPLLNLSMKGVDQTATYYSYASALIPSISDSVVHNDKIMVFSGEVRGYVVGVLDILDNTIACLSSRDRNNPPDGPPPSPILIIKGTAGSGKSATLHHILRRVRDHIASTSGEATQTMSPLYVPLKVEDDCVQYGAIRHIIEAVWAWSTCVTQENRMNVVVNFLLATYPLVNPEALEIAVFPVIREALALTWPYPAHMVQSRRIVEWSDTHTIPVDTEIMTALTRYILEDAHVPMVAVDDAHNMSTACWDVLTKLCLSGCRTVLLLTLSVRGAYESRDACHSHVVHPIMSTSHSSTRRVDATSTDWLNCMTGSESLADIDTTVAIK